MAGSSWTVHTVLLSEPLKSDPKRLRPFVGSTFILSFCFLTQVVLGVPEIFEHVTPGPRRPVPVERKHEEKGLDEQVSEPDHNGSC